MNNNKTDTKEFIAKKEKDAQKIKVCIKKEEKKELNNMKLKSNISEDKLALDTQIGIVKEKTKMVKGKAESKKYKNNNISKGDFLEYRMKRLLFYMGYLPKIGIKLKVNQERNSEDITDLDVLGFYIHRDFRKLTTWVDCKSGKARPLEHIVWIKGMNNIFPVDNVLFVKNSVKYTVKEFARKNNIQVIDINGIEKLERDLHIDRNEWKGSWNPQINLCKLENLSKLSKPNNINYKKLAYFITYDYWNENKYTKIKKCMTAFRLITELPYEFLNNEEQDIVRWTIYEIITLFSLSVLEVCEELYYFGQKERKSILNEKLVSGEIPMSKRKNIVSASYSLANEIVKSKVPDFIMPPNLKDFSVLNTPPAYFESLLDLIDRIINNPNYYYDILRVLDYILFEYELQTKDIDIDDVKNRFSNFKNNIFGIKTIINYICQIALIDRNFFTVLSIKNI